MTLKLNLFSIRQNLIEPEWSSQKTEIGTQVLNKLLLGTYAGNSSRSSSPWNFSCHLLLQQYTSFNHCKELQLCLGVLFFLVILTGKILKKAGHCTTGTQTIPMLPEGWGQAMLENGSQTFRWHLARKKLVMGPGQPGSPSSHDSPSAWRRTALPPAHATPRAWGLQPGPPRCLALAQQGPKALLKHTTHTNPSGIDLLGELTQSGLFEVQGNTGYISKQY